ncbi:MAG TPA: alpha-hydroxy acid oxidase [Kaistia sp.]|nr:alpha-hydroxy acid oxidase [Kaistia sp.]
MMTTNVEEFRVLARRRLPRMFFDYLDGGAFSENTLRRNRTDFDKLVLEQRVLRDISRRDLSHTFLGQRSKLPMMLAPIGFCGMMCADGEVKAARAAEAAGIGMCLSTFSIASVEKVAASVKRPIAFQLYIFRDRALAEIMVDRAEKAGVNTLFLTVDTAVSGIRERDTRNGFRTATRLGIRPMVDLALHPRWCLSMAPLGRPQLGNAAGVASLGNGLMEQASRLSAQLDPSLVWEDLAWLRNRWKGRLVVKGILSVHDAERAVGAGADAIVVSNHGGRQLDSASSTIAMLPSIARAIGGRAEILLDGGIRRGTDIFKALALGADGVLLGRAYVYGLAAAGGAGIAGVIEHLRAELDVTMGLTGLSSIAELRATGADLVHAA